MLKFSENRRIDLQSFDLERIFVTWFVVTKAETTNEPLKHKIGYNELSGLEFEKYEMSNVIDLEKCRELVYLRT